MQIAYAAVTCTSIHVFCALAAGGKKKLKLRNAASFTVLVNMSGDVGYNAYKQTQLFRQNKFEFDEYPFVLMLTLRKTSVEVNMQPANSSVPVRMLLHLSNLPNID